MNIGSDVPEVTWIAFRCLFRLGIARPSPIPAAIAATIHTGRKRSRNESRAMTGTPATASLGGRSDATSVTVRPRQISRCA